MGFRVGFSSVDFRVGGLLNKSTQYWVDSALSSINIECGFLSCETTVSLNDVA